MTDKTLPKPLQELIEAIGQLPGVGPRTTQRFAYWLYKNPPTASTSLAEALSKLHSQVTVCPVTFALIDKNQKVSHLYRDVKRDKQLVAVVAEPLDIAAIEKTGAYHGTYHVLGGLVSPIDGITPADLRIKELATRLKKDHVKELILALNASVESESTALVIMQAIDGSKVKVTRLARGLPVGVDIEYADQITLLKALEGRQNIS